MRCSLYRGYEGYLNRLTAAGYKVAICEQTEDPAKAKGLVNREIVRIVTPGTTVSPELLPRRQPLPGFLALAGASCWYWAGQGRSFHG